MANSQEAWFPQDQPADKETIESLIERLDATVLGLVEALDADSADLPRLLDEALTGSLWSRQIGRLAQEQSRGRGGNAFLLSDCCKSYEEVQIDVT